MSLATATNFSDEQLVQGVLEGETALFELLMRRYNQRIFRICRSILRDDTEAEDVAQEAYVRAYEHLRQFEGRAQFSTWLSRIAVNEALQRLKQRRRKEEIDAMPEEQRDARKELSSRMPDPETKSAANETRSLLERCIDALPDNYREVFVLRDVEEMSTADAAATLNITEENVKTRLHRARALLRRELYSRAGATSAAAFQFMGARCDRLVAKVMSRVRTMTPAEPSEKAPR
jgi:RNA polymerase sigma-70 factor, ECF subfamily